MRPHSSSARKRWDVRRWRLFRRPLTAEPHFRERSLELAAMGGTTSPADPIVSVDPPDAGTSPAEHATMPDAATNPDASMPPATRKDIGVTAQYQANNAAARDNVIGPFLQITNASGTAPIALESLRVRYYFTNEHAELCPDGCRVEGYYAGIHPTGQGVTADRRYVVGDAQDAKNAYLEITFAPGSPSLQPGQSVEVQQYFHTNPYLEFDETDDYSFDATFSAFKDAPKITVYDADAFVWGEPPR
jgi:endoglucanase